MRKACAGEQCDRHAYYGVPGGKPIFCALHKEVGYVNVHNKMCSRQGCYKRPHYGHVGGKAVSCVTHKLPGECCAGLANSAGLCVQRWGE